MGVSAVMVAAEATPVREYPLQAEGFQQKILDVNFTSPSPE